MYCMNLRFLDDSRILASASAGFLLLLAALWWSGALPIRPEVRVWVRRLIGIAIVVVGVLCALDGALSPPRPFHSPVDPWASYAIFLALAVFMALAIRAARRQDRRDRAREGGTPA
jgi:hypothetical protein